MCRHGPVIAHCTDSEDFPYFVTHQCCFSQRTHIAWPCITLLIDMIMFWLTKLSYVKQTPISVIPSTTGSRTAVQIKRARINLNIG